MSRSLPTLVRRSRQAPRPGPRIVAALLLLPGLHSSAAIRSPDVRSDAARAHWAFRPVVDPALPPVKNAGWVRNPIDRFVLARLEAAGLSPAPAADRRTLLRRATFDLIGLPPTPRELDAFLSDDSPDAFARVVDRLLASPRYGERWGRHWLDVARYADTKGYVFEEERKFPCSYTYRDWVIAALNDDLPYDQFLIQQIAADRLPLGNDKRALAAEGFLTLGRRFLNRMPDIIDDRIDVVCRGTLALTVGCARCHDHKFDPIPTADYYSLYSVFKNSPDDPHPPALMPPVHTPASEAFDNELTRRQRAVDAYLDEQRKALLASAAGQPPVDLSPGHLQHLLKGDQKKHLRDLQKAVDELEATDPAAPPRPACLHDVQQPEPQQIFMRGNPENPGATVPAQFLAILSSPDRKPFTDGSGRLELARAIASPTNPLTARVMVNRVWLEHFGSGIVQTPSDFGLRSDPPTHPELLDWLATRFVAGKWSLKKLHRLILLSSTYQQSSEANPAAAAVDPQNLLMWRMNPRRLDFEATRDTLLAVSGSIDLQMYGRAVDITTQQFSTRRTVYGFIDRQNLPGLFRNFDFASPDTHCPRRFSTTVPQQALYMMNDPFVIQQARQLVQRQEVATATEAESRIDVLYKLLISRPPTPEELALGRSFVEQEEAMGREGEVGARPLSAWEKYAQVLLESDEFVFAD